jgi:hypothetical protein
MVSVCKKPWWNRRRSKETTMRGLASAISLLVVTTPALGANPRVDAAVTVFQAVGTDANRLKTFCEMMKIDEKVGEKKAPALRAQIDKLLDQLGADFKDAWNAVEDIDENSSDGKALNSALDQLENKCPN